MKHEDFLRALGSPVPSVLLKKYPNGNIYQLWGESPELYANAFGHHDDLHKYLGGHSGIDIIGAHRTPICAAHDGYISTIKTDRVSLGGLIIWVTSPVLDLGSGNSCVTTAYGHLDEIIVSQGQNVRKGDVIGYMGNTGFVVSGGVPYWGNAPAGKGTHLHFGLYEFTVTNGVLSPRWNNVMQNSTDPLPYLTGDLSGLIGILKQMVAYIAKLSGNISK